MPVTLLNLSWPALLPSNATSSETSNGAGVGGETRPWGVLRWTVMAFDPALAILFAMQALHALTFAAAHVAVVRYIGRNVAGNLSTTAQTINSALHGGVFLAVGFWLGGAVYSISPAHAFWLMAGFALVGSLVLLAGMRTETSVQQQYSDSF